MIIFAPSTIIAQWAAQILYFDTALVPELRVYCADNDVLGYGQVQPLSAQPGGGVYVERATRLRSRRSRSCAALTCCSWPRRCSLGADPWTAGLKASRKPPSVAALYQLIPTLRLCVVDESTT